MAMRCECLTVSVVLLMTLAASLAAPITAQTVIVQPSPGVTIMPPRPDYVGNALDSWIRELSAREAQQRQFQHEKEMMEMQMRAGAGNARTTAAASRYSVRDLSTLGLGNGRLWDVMHDEVRGVYVIGYIDSPNVRRMTY